MLPRSALTDVPYRNGMNVQFRPNLGARSKVNVFNAPRLGLSQLGRPALFANWLRAVTKSVKRVFQSRRPAKVGRVYAAALSASMRHLKLWRGFGPIPVLAGDNVAGEIATTITEVDVALRLFIIPEYAFVCGRRRKHFRKERDKSFP